MKRKNNLTYVFIVLIIAVLTIVIFDKYKSFGNFFYRHNYKVSDMDDVMVLDNDYDYKLLFNEPYNDGKYYLIKGIDISGYQKEIDFEKVKEAGYEFVYIRIGNRGYTEGLLYEDQMFDEYYNQAKAAGLKVGAYFFSQAITVEEAMEEAFFCDDILDGRELDLEIVYDFEYISEAEARTDNLSNDLKTDMALAFCQKMESFGYKAMIYANYDQLTTQYNLNQIMNYPLWYAEYGVDYPTFTKPFVMWQYTQYGKVDGIEGYVDLDYRIKEINQQ